LQAYRWAALAMALSWWIAARSTHAQHAPADGMAANISCCRSQYTKPIYIARETAATPPSH